MHSPSPAQYCIDKSQFNIGKHPEKTIPKDPRDFDTLLINKHIKSVSNIAPSHYQSEKILGGTYGSGFAPCAGKYAAIPKAARNIDVRIYA